MVLPELEYKSDDGRAKELWTVVDCGGRGSGLVVARGRELPSVARLPTPQLAITHPAYQPYMARPRVTPGVRSKADRKKASKSTLCVAQRVAWYKAHSPELLSIVFYTLTVLTRL